MSDKCEYPNCRCPFDMGPDNLCLIGKPNTDTAPPVSAGEAVAVADDDPLPCPFCGSSDVGGAGGTVGCYRCPAEIAVQNTNTAYAVELWNNRASAEVGGEAVAKITTEMKAQCIGEFEFAIDVPCGECLVEGEDEDCEVCSGELTHQRSVEVPWDTCKEIYKRMAKFAPKAQGVPKGWRLVPIEPTPEMRDAAQAAFERRMMVTYQQMFRAMVNASPTQPTFLGVDYSRSFILRKQAEAVREAADDMLDDFPDYDLAHACLLVRVQSLHAEAVELESDYSGGSGE